MGYGVGTGAVGPGTGTGTGTLMVCVGQGVVTTDGVVNDVVCSSGRAVVIGDGATPEEVITTLLTLVLEILIGIYIRFSLFMVLFKLIEADKLKSFLLLLLLLSPFPSIIVCLLPLSVTFSVLSSSSCLLIQQSLLHWFVQVGV